MLLVIAGCTTFTVLVPFVNPAADAVTVAVPATAGSVPWTKYTASVVPAGTDTSIAPAPAAVSVGERSATLGGGLVTGPFTLRVEWNPDGGWVRFSPTNVNRIYHNYVQIVNGFARSDDGGTTWQLKNAGWDERA